LVCTEVARPSTTISRLQKPKEKETHQNITLSNMSDMYEGDIAQEVPASEDFAGEKENIMRGHKATISNPRAFSRPLPASTDGIPYQKLPTNMKMPLINRDVGGGKGALEEDARVHGRAV
jgi:hypothetical protein